VAALQAGELDFEAIDAGIRIVNRKCDLAGRTIRKLLLILEMER
jgi:hypothetical protein